MQSYQPRLPRTPKFHWLVCHIIPFTKQFHTWGSLSEQGVEAIHHKMNNDLTKAKNTRNTDAILERLTNASSVRNSIYDENISINSLPQGLISYDTEPIVMPEEEAANEEIVYERIPQMNISRGISVKPTSESRSKARKHKSVKDETNQIFTYDENKEGEEEMEYRSNRCERRVIYHEAGGYFTWNEEHAESHISIEDHNEEPTKSVEAIAKNREAEYDVLQTMHQH